MKNIKSLLLAALVGLSSTSCNDFLELEPLNDIVLENFWTDKSDVESVLLGAYSALETSDCLLRMVIWGEMRSDNMTESNSSPEAIQQICRENLLITNDYCKYNKFYDVINRANTVLHFAPIVADKDPNYLWIELKANEAEAVALRCLCYWYLIRAFHDVPYVTEPSIDDEGGYKKFYVPQSDFDTILTQIIADLESVKDDAMKKYPSDLENTARITQSAICAMLADMYLWRGQEGDYDKCISVCQEITTQKKKEFEDLKIKKGKDNTIKEYNGYPLISNIPNNEILGNAYNEIFGTGNSFESLFELPYDDKVSNGLVSSYYQSSSNAENQSTGNVKALDKIGSVRGEDNSVFVQMHDTRYHQSVVERGTSYGICKYAYSSVSITGTSSGVDLSESTMRNSSSQPNWIIYRYSEVLLFEAEANIMKAKSIHPSGADSLAMAFEVSGYLNKAFDLIDAVNKRAIGYIAEEGVSKPFNPKTLSKEDYPSVSMMENLLFQERRRELMFEGKRWFDLVRISRRDGNQNRMLRFLSDKFSASVYSAVKIRLKDPYAMYFPMAKDEVKNSQGVLRQNPVYKDDEDVKLATH